MTLPQRITRRQACLSLLAGAVATSSRVRSLQAAPSEFRLKYVLGSCMYGTTSLAEILPEIAKAGCEGIDIWPLKHGNQREQIEEMGHEAFLKLLEMQNARLRMITRYDLGVEKIEEEIPTLKKFGGTLLITGASKAEGKTLRDQVKAFLNRLTPQVKAAEEAGITIGIENHGGNLLATPDSIRYFAEFAQSSHLGIALAPYHLPQEEKLLSDLIRELGDKLVHFYAWEHGMGCMTKLPKEQELMQLPGRGLLDFTPLVHALRKINYQGWTEIFMHPVPRGIPILEPTSAVTEAINTSRAYLEKCLQS